MRKKLLFVMFAALCCNGLFAQDEYLPGVGETSDDRPNRIAIGPKVGLGIGLGSHSNVQNLDFDMGLSYQVGVAFNAHFGRRYEMSDGGTGLFAIEIEAMYGKNALKIGSDGFGVNCIEVPVLAQLYVTPAFAIEAGATAVKFLNGSPAQLAHDNATYGIGEIKGGDVMATAGLCYKAPFGLMIDARYNLGLSPLAGNFDTKVSTVMVSLTYLFNIVK